MSSSADAPPMVYVNGILYKQSPQQICYNEKHAGFLYLGKIVSDVTERQSSADGAGQNAAEGLIENTTEGSAQNTAEDSAPNIRNGIEQFASESVPKENLQANTPIVGAEAYQYNSDIVVLINGKYWLYEPIISDGGTILEECIPEGNREAEEAARAYYAGTVFEVVSLEPESREEDTVTFAVTVKKGGVIQEPDRKIILRKNQGTWEVINEGY